MPDLPLLSTSLLREIAAVLGDTEGGLSNREINSLLAEAGLDDPTPEPPPGAYKVISKRDRLFNALAARQQKDKAPHAILCFVEISMQPVRYADAEVSFDERRSALNQRLLHAGLELTEQGRIRHVMPASTTSEARERTRRFRGKLDARRVHPRVIAACGAEIRDENYFHTVLEAAKSLVTEIRRLSGLKTDGTTLVREAFEFKKGSFPRVAFNKIESETDRSEHVGLTNLCHGVFGAFRNPTAHEPKITWVVSEEDALDICTLISFLQRRLDDTTPVPDSLRSE